MKAERRHQLASNALARELEGFPGFLKRWGNTALTVLLVILAIVLLIRWRLASAEQARQQVLFDLASARRYVEELRSPMLTRQPPEYLATARQEYSSRANEAITSILNTSDDSHVRAQALVTRGDLYWQLANFPELPGATTRPSLRAGESSDDYLKKAADAYNEVLKSPDLAKQAEPAAAARFGLAAIAENKHDWDEATRQLEAIANATDAPAALRQQAKRALDSQLPQMRKPYFLVSPTQASTQPFLPTTTATTEPQASLTTQPATQPAQ
jgi:hypothetical protein